MDEKLFQIYSDDAIYKKIHETIEIHESNIFGMKYTIKTLINQLNDNQNNNQNNNQKDKFDSINKELNESIKIYDLLYNYLNHLKKKTSQYYTKHEYFILYKIENKYLFGKGKYNYVKNLSKYIKEEDIIINLDHNIYPPINFINILKQYSEEKNSLIIKKINNDIKNIYPKISKTEFEKLFNAFYNSEKIFEIKFETLILNNSKIEDIIQIYNDLIKKISETKNEII